MLRSSFLSYLGDADPYVGPDDGELKDLLDELIAQQASLAHKVALLIRELGSEEELCDFPAEFTDAHDLAIGYALRRAAKDHRKNLTRLGALRHEQADPRAEELLAEVYHGAEAIADQLDKATQPTAV